MPLGTTYTPVEVYQIVKKVDESHGGKNVTGRVHATAIILRESGGNARAYRDASQNKYGGNDRGWWQFNSKAWPNVTDAIAYDPVASTELAYKTTSGFKSGAENWKPWALAKGLDEKFVIQAAQAAKSTGEDLGADDSILDTIGGAAASTVDAVTDAVTPDWLAGLGKLLANLLNPTWWKRIGIGALGVIILVVALIIVFGKDVAEEVKPI